MREHLGDLSLELPEGWGRRTILTLEGPTQRGVAPNIVVVRETVPESTTLVLFATRQLAELAVAPESGRFVELRGRVAFQVGYEWRAHDGIIAQTSTFFETRGPTERAITCVSTSCAREDVGACGPLFAAVLASVRFLDAGGDPAPALGAESLRAPYDPAPRSMVAPRGDMPSGVDLPRLPPMPDYEDIVPMPGIGRRR